MQTKGLQMGLFPNGQRHEEVAISMFFEMRGFRMFSASRELRSNEAMHILLFPGFPVTLLYRFILGNPVPY